MVGGRNGKGKTLMAARKRPEGEPEPLKAHIQARLHEHNPDGGRERDAIQFYQSEELVKRKWDDRRIVTEALLALRMYWEEGYRPPDNPQGMVTSEILAMAKEARETLQLAREAMQMLSTLDLTSLRTQSGWREEVWEKTSLVVNKGAAAIMGHAKSYGDDDDD
jgi:hypothetical protein